MNALQLYIQFTPQLHSKIPPSCSPCPLCCTLPSGHFPNLLSSLPNALPFLQSIFTKGRTGNAWEHSQQYIYFPVIIIIIIIIRRMWNLKCTIVPVKTGVTGIVTRSLRKNLEAVPGKHSIDSLQKTATLGTSHIIWKVLQCEA